MMDDIVLFVWKENNTSNQSNLTTLIESSIGPRIPSKQKIDKIDYADKINESKIILLMRCPGFLTASKSGSCI